MKTIVAGSRDNTAYEQVCEAIARSGIEITELVSGRARGTDTYAERWAAEQGVPVKPFPVEDHEWRTVGKSAGPARNRRMADYAEALIAIWDGKSPGTRNMIDEARKRNLVVFVLRV